jgi:hypothetical protein
VASRAINGVLMVREYRLHGICDVKYKCGKRGIGRSGGIKEREEAGRTIGSHMNWVPLLSALVSSISKSATSCTRYLMLLGVASTYCEKFGT